MQGFDIKEFRSAKPFNGFDLLEMVKDNDLHGYEVESYERQYVKDNSLTTMNPWTYVIRFRKVSR